MLFVIVVLKLASSLIAAASSFSVSNVVGAASTSAATSESTYPFEAASPGLTGVLRFVIVAVVPASMFNVPLMVTSLNVEDPVLAVTLPVISPETLPVIVPVAVRLSKVDVPVDAVTLPARSPVKPLFAVAVVKVAVSGVVAPIIVPSIVPPSISTVANDARFDVSTVVKRAVSGLVTPICVASMLPPLMSTVAIVAVPVTPTLLEKVADVPVMPPVFSVPESVVLPVTPRVPATVAFSSTSSVSICAVPSRYKSRNSLVDVPKSRRFVVDGTNDVAISELT